MAATQQPSAYDNAARLIADAAALLKADADNIVFTGGSRGGTTALCIASNPTGAPYTAAYVEAQNPQVKINAAINRYVNPGYGLIQRSVEFVTGYKDSWPSDWVVPPGEANAGVDRDTLVRTVLFGTTNQTVIDDELSADSVLSRNGLAAADPGVILSLGTHDYSRPFVQTAEYVNNLEGTTLTVLCNVLYRFGHVDAGVAPSHAELLDRVFQEKAGQTPPPLTGTPGGVELAYWATDPNDATLPVPITSPHVPAILENPIVVGDQQDFTVVVVGEPGALVEVFQSPLIPTWVPGQDCCGVTDCCSATSGSCLGQADYPGCFTGAPGPSLGAPFLSSGPVFGTFVFDVDQAADPLPLGYTWYELYYGPHGGPMPHLGQGDLALEGEPAPGIPAGVTQFIDPCTGAIDPFELVPKFDQPVLRVVDCAPEVFAASEASRTGGLAGDALHLP